MQGQPDVVKKDAGSDAGSEHEYDKLILVLVLRIQHENPVCQPTSRGGARVQAGVKHRDCIVCQMVKDAGQDAATLGRDVANHYSQDACVE